MKIRRGIFGGALLFAAAGCTDTKTTAPVDTASEVSAYMHSGDTATGTDATVTDAAVPSDANLNDAVIADVTNVDATKTDVGLIDAHSADATGVDATDDTAPPTDVAEPVDVSEPMDVAQPVDVPDPMDIADPMDVAEPMDVSEPVDVSETDSSGCKLLTVDNALGQKCDEPMTAICNPEKPQEVALLCLDSTWQKMADLENKFPFGCFCDSGPEECSYAFAACAVPGFVGLDRAGRVRTAPRRLRLV